MQDNSKNCAVRVSAFEFLCVCVCALKQKGATHNSTGLTLDLPMENDRPRRHSLQFEHMQAHMTTLNSMSFDRFWNLLFCHIEYNWFPCELQ